MKKIITSIVGILIVVGVVIIGWQLFNKPSAPANTSKKIVKKVQKPKASQSSSSDTDGIKIKVKNANKPKTVSLTDSDKSDISNTFLQWAGQRAEMGNMAVSSWFFDHGAAGHGDWYALSDDGNIQVQNMDHPGSTSFSIHAIGGVVFYTSLDGTTGVQDLSNYSFADNYSKVVDRDKPVVKYLLADNGKVYELKLSQQDGSLAPSTNSGFYEFTDDGIPDATAMDKFSVSQDEAAQSELTKLLTPYRQ
ncbi:hypothetical protein [Weissella confusa]|uniref:Uncharacterized protein n=1 Tax=Weissella confusa TaxID=1583 RepID=A0A4Z0RZ21_WEICO|nr:hypothetical protein [Weissella confusa]TGE71861.1 hypothetical protein C6P11_07590 [Weissella confusa]